MYRINVLSRGKYNNVEPGCRYAITKRKTKDFIKFIEYFECHIEVEKLYYNDGIFYWVKEI